MATVDFSGSITVETDGEHTVEEMCGEIQQQITDHIAAVGAYYDTTSVGSLDSSVSL